jgi:hypothetical protein
VGKSEKIYQRFFPGFSPPNLAYPAQKIKKRLFYSRLKALNIGIKYIAIQHYRQPLCTLAKTNINIE